MNIVVAGGAGFIGSNFVHYLRRTEPQAKITVFDKLTYAGMKESLWPLLENKEINFIEGDICDQPQIQSAFKGADLIYNFAAESHVDNSIADPKSFLDTNIGGVYSVLQVLRTFEQPPLLVQVSTDEVYGELTNSEPAFNLDSPIRPSSPYSASKAAGDHLALSYYKTFDLPVIVTRSSNNYGPRQMPEKFIPRMLFRSLRGETLPIYGDGKQRRDWIYVEDNCEGLWLVANKGRPGQIYHFGTGLDIENIELAKMILAQLKQSEDLIEYVKDRPGHDFRYCLDYQDTAKQLNWQPKVKIAEGLADTVKWYQENEKWLKLAHERIRKENQ